MQSRTAVEKNGKAPKAKRTARSGAPDAHSRRARPAKAVKPPHPANVTRGKPSANARTEAKPPHPANVTHGKPSANARTEAKPPHPAASPVARADAKSAGARKSTPPHPATVTASRRPQRNGNGEVKPPHPANREAPNRISRLGTDGRAGSPETRPARSADIDYDGYVERILQLEAGADARALIQQLGRLNSADLCNIAERFTNSTSWRAVGQVKWLRGEAVDVDTRRVSQVCMQRAAGGLTTRFEAVELPVDAVLAPDWQAMGRFVKGRVLDFSVRCAT